MESATGGTAYDADSMSASAGGGLKVNFGTNGMGAGVNVYASLGGSGSDYEAIYHRNAAVAARNDLTTKSGADTTIAGARVQGSTVTMNVGDDLVVASRQDESDGGSHSFGVSADVMLGIGASGSISVNAGKGESSSGWVREQTAIIGKEKVDIRVEDNTHVEGAVIAAENGNLKLDTNTLTYADIKDHDKASNINIGVSVSGSYGGGGYSTQKSWGELLGTDSGGGKPATGAAGSKDGGNKDGDKFQAVPTAGSIDYSARDRQQINRATIGEGTIIIRANPDAGLEGLNRDLARAQEITKDSETVVSVYIDPAVIREIADGFGGIRKDFGKITDALGKAVEKLRAAPAMNEQVRKELRGMLMEGLSATKLSAALSGQKKGAYADLIVAGMEKDYQALRQNGLSHADAIGEITNNIVAFQDWANTIDQKGLNFISIGGETYLTLPGIQNAYAIEGAGTIVLAGTLIVGAIVASVDKDAAAPIVTALKNTMTANGANETAVKYIPGYGALTHQAVVQFEATDGSQQELLLDDVRVDQAGMAAYGRDKATGHYYRVYADGSADVTRPLQMADYGEFVPLPGYADNGGSQPSIHDNTPPPLPGTNPDGYTDNTGGVGTDPLTTPDQGGVTDTTHTTPDQSGTAGEYLLLATGVNQMRQQVQKGLAPESVVRVEYATENGTPKAHVHFEGGSSIYQDGTWRHGWKKLSSAEKKWLKTNGWGLPNE